MFHNRYIYRLYDHICLWFSSLMDRIDLIVLNGKYVTNAPRLLVLGLLQSRVADLEELVSFIQSHLEHGQLPVFGRQCLCKVVHL